MGSITDLYTAEAEKKGKTIPVVGLDGKDSGETITVLGAFSPEYRAAELDFWRTVRDIGSEITEEGRKAVKDASEALAATLLIGWSFDEPFTEKAKLEALEKAPRFREQIIQYAQDGTNWMTKKKEPSATTQAGKDGSTEKTGGVKLELVADKA